MEQLLLHGGGMGVTLCFLAQEVPHAELSEDREWRTAQGKVVGPNIALSFEFSAMEREIESLRHSLTGFGELHSHGVKWSNFEGDVELELTRGVRGNVTARVVIGVDNGSKLSIKTEFELENMPLLRTIVE